MATMIEGRNSRLCRKQGRDSLSLAYKSQADKVGLPWSCSILASKVALRACCPVAEVFKRQPTVASAARVAAVHGICYQCLYRARTFSTSELKVPYSNSFHAGAGWRC